jgi:DNA (cytosine-5)-methyltransferase 1
MARKANPPSGFPLTAVSLFTGAGGLDLGFARAGFDIRLCIERDPSAVATLRANGITRIWQADISDERVVTPRRILGKAGLRAGELGLVIGGPPCQPFSQPGTRRGLRDARGQLVYHFARLVRGLRPRAFVFENVSGILSGQMKGAIELLTRIVGKTGAAGGGYQVEIGVLNAADYGVPQLRNRTFVVGWRGRGCFYFPAPTHYRPDRQIDRENRPKLRRCPTVGDALRGLPAPEPPSSHAVKVAATVPQRNREWHGK